MECFSENFGHVCRIVRVDGRTRTRRAQLILQKRKLSPPWRLLGEIIDMCRETLLDGTYGFIQILKYRRNELRTHYPSSVSHFFSWGEERSEFIWLLVVA